MFCKKKTATNERFHKEVQEVPFSHDFLLFFQDKLGFSAAAKACKMPPAGCLKMIAIHKKWILFLMLFF